MSMTNTNDSCCDCETYCSGRDVELANINRQILNALKLANSQQLRTIYAFIVSFLKIDC